MQKPVVGTYVVEVVSQTVDLVGKNDTPALILELKPTAFSNGSVFIDGDYYPVRKFFFLTDTVFKGGKYVGKSAVEVARIELEELFGYTGDLSKEQLAQLTGKKAIAVLAMRDQYLEVKYLNPIRKNKAKTAAISDDLFRKLNGKFSGKAETTPAPSDFFDQFKK